MTTIHFFPYTKIGNYYQTVTPTKIDDTQLEVVLPTLDGERTYLLEIDRRDQRPIIVFDGDVPSGGLMRGGSVVHSWPLTQLCVPYANVRAPKTGELLPPWTRDGDRATLQLFRRCLLVRKGRCLVTQYRENLSSRYRMLTINPGHSSVITSQSTEF